MRRIHLLFLFLAASTAYADTQTVSVLASKLRKAPKMWADASGDVRYGDTVSVLGREKGWYQVRTEKGRVGYLHESALTTKRVLLKSSASSDIEVDPSEVILAGKGFNGELELDYAKRNPALRFSDVDTLEKSSPVSSSELHAFIAQGKLKEGDA